MELQRNELSDGDLRDGILHGLAAYAELQERFRKPLERFLVGMCDRGDGRSQDRAVEIASQILMECFTGSPSLLEKWQGDDNLGAFLRTAARNRLKSWWISAETRRTETHDDPQEFANTNSTNILLAGAEEEQQLHARTLRAGVNAAAGKSPEGLVFLRLKGLHGVDQRAISRCWGHHEAQTSRRIKDAMELIRKTATAEAERLGLEMSTELLNQAQNRNPEILLGEAGAPVDAPTDATLRKLAAGGADSSERNLAVTLMCENAQALEHFARLLNRSEHEAVMPRDPALSGMDARILDSVRVSLGILHPGEAPSLITQLMERSFSDALHAIGADGGTLWLLRPRESTLEAVFNPTERPIVGMRQPLVSGIISLVLATGETCCVNDVEQHQRHSPAIDMVLGKNTHSMIAVPFCPAEIPMGVLTAVRLADSDGFTTAQTESFERHGLVFAELFTASLTRCLLGQRDPARA